MGNAGRYFALFSVAVLWICALGLQRPPPRYSQQFMPETSFSCRNKIVGSYYADPETDCQLFHVCVSVAGSTQDFKFLCPNDTAFDQESQTCADWYDVDCEAATLYYASDNFDLYRIGSGLESVHYDNIRSDIEPQDHLQRSETSDPVRSSSNNFNKVSSTSYNSNNNNNNNRDILRGSSSGNYYNNRNGKEEDYDNEKTYKEPENVNKKKTGVRKVSRKQQYNGNNANSQSPSSTAAPTTLSNYNGNNNYYNNNNYNQRTSGVVPSTTVRAFVQDNYNRNQNTQKYNIPSTTLRPSTNYQNSYNSYSTTSRTTAYNTNYNTNSNYNGNQQTSNVYTQSTTAKPNFNNAKNFYDHQSYTSSQYNQPTTIQPSTSYQQNDYTNYQKVYNHHQRGGNSNAGTYPSSTVATTVYDNSYNNYNGNGQYRNGGSSGRQDQVVQTTAKYYSSYTPSSYAPTTYSPATKKYVSADNSQAQTVSRNSNDRYNDGQDDGRYYDKTVKPSTQYYDSTKSPKKTTQYNNDYDNSKYYTESSTGSYDFGRSSAGIGFSPSSINHLAETPRSTTASPRRASSATTYNPNSFSTNTQRSQQSTTPRVSTFVSGSARPFSSTTRFNENTTVKPKTGKKNDYDYAYYDNAGTLEYDGLELEQVTRNKESSKIARN